MISRRRFLHSLIALPLVSGTSLSLSSHAFAAPQPASALLSAWDDDKGQHFIGALGFDGEPVFSFPVTQRAHDACTGPDGQVLFVARRPGTELQLLETAGLPAPRLRTRQADTGRHFYGHGCFSPDGKKLFLCENDFENGRGLIGVYRSSDLQKEREFETGGIGPHQLKWLPDGKTLVVANGGILTHPDYGREKLNLDALESSLAYLQAEDGELQQLVPCEQKGMSLRHLDVAGDGTVLVAAQYQFEDESLQSELLFAHRMGEQALQSFQAEDWQWLQHQGYIASVAVDASGDHVMITSPRGNLASLWHSRSRHLLASYTINDVAGVVWHPASQAFLLSNGRGQFYRQTLSDSSPTLIKAQPEKLWDNHLNLFQA